MALCSCLAVRAYISILLTKYDSRDIYLKYYIQISVLTFLTILMQEINNCYEFYHPNGNCTFKPISN